MPSSSKLREEDMSQSYPSTSHLSPVSLSLKGTKVRRRRLPLTSTSFLPLYSKVMGG